MSTKVEVVDVAQKFGMFSEYWHPRIAGQLNDSYIKLVKFKGEFVWHLHENEDELFWVIEGTLVIRLRDGDITLRPGQFAIIPKGVEHMPVADEEVHAVLLEPKTTLNTGNVQNERTVEAEWI